MHTYIVYGLRVQSEIPLPLPSTVPGKNYDVSIRLDKLDRQILSKQEEEYFLHRSRDEVVFYWNQVGAFLVRDGREIIIDPHPNVPQELIHLPLLGMVFSVVLHHRSFLVLHGSAVLLKNNEAAVAFLGHRGLGKSTIAAAFVAQGYRLLGDDLVALDFSSGQPLLYPGNPQFKLMPDVSKALFGEKQPKTIRVMGIKKQIVWADGDTPTYPVRLKCLFALKEGESFIIRALSAQDALFRLVGQSYPARVFNDDLTALEARLNFCQCSQIVNDIPFFQLQRTNSLAHLMEIPKLISAHCAKL